MGFSFRRGMWEEDDTHQCPFSRNRNAFVPTEETAFFQRL